MSELGQKWAQENLMCKILHYFDDVIQYADTLDVYPVITHFYDGSGCLKDQEGEYLMEWDNPADFYKKVFHEQE